VTQLDEGFLTLIRSYTLDCPLGTTDRCDVTGLNSVWKTIKTTLSPSNFSSYVVAVATVASSQDLLYHGIPLPTASATGNTSSKSVATSTVDHPSLNGPMEPTSSTSPTASPTSGSFQLPSSSSSKAKNYTWIAGAVIAPLSILLLIIAVIFFRQKKKIGIELEKSDDVVGDIHGIAELQGDSLSRPQVQWGGRPRSELPVGEPAAAELF